MEALNLLSFYFFRTLVNKGKNVLVKIRINKDVQSVADYRLDLNHTRADNDRSVRHSI